MDSEIQALNLYIKCLEVECMFNENFTSFKVESIYFTADGVTASCAMSFCKQESPMTLSFTDLTSQAIKNMRNMSSL